MPTQMKFPFPLLIAAAIFIVVYAQARDMVTDRDPFLRLEDIPKEILMPQNAKITVDSFGNYLVNGKMRYMAGISNSTGNYDINIKETEGYPESLNWLYQDVLTYESAQRLGFDTLSIFTPPVWLKQLDPGVPVAGQNPLNWKWTERMLSNHLPLLLDSTAFPFDHGSLRYSEKLEQLRRRFPDEVFNRSTRTNHWVPYNIFHPEARKIWAMIWENGFEEMKRHGGGPVFACELFNEPAYDDPSEYNRKLFAAYLEKKFITVERMNSLFRSRFASFAEASGFSPEKKNTPLSIEWGRFQEDGFTDLCRFGAEVVQRKAPGTRVCTQILGGNYYRCVPASNVNIFDISRYMDSISLPTGGGIAGFTTILKAPESSVAAPALPGDLSEGILMRHLFRGFADGKPIHSPETYARKSREGNLDIEWLDLLRGSGITYFFSWYRGYPQWIPEKTAEGGRKLAEKMPYLLVNPYGFHPDALTGFLAGKEEIASLADFFVSRERFQSIPRRVALMLSLPSERYGFHEGETRKNELVNYAAALEFAHFLPDAFHEEQLREKRADRYRVLVAVGMTNTYPETLPALEDFVRKGGVLIAARGLMNLDEYGNPRRSPLFEGLSGRDAAGKSADLRFSAGFAPDRRLPGAVRGIDDWRVAASGDWTVLAGIGETPALLTRKFGEGHVYVIAPRMQDYAVAAVLGGILARHGIDPAVELYRSGKNDLAVNLEAHPGRSGNLTAVFVQNHDRYPKLSEAVLPGGAECGIDVRKKTLLPRIGDRVLFANDSTASTILCFGSKADLEKRFGALKPYGEKELREDFRKIEQKHEAYLNTLQNDSFVFDADPAGLIPLDLRRFANRGFDDARPDDGEGGWTDQGRDGSLEGVPWGTVNFCGIPCDLIRFDTNDNRTCVMLNSPTLKEKLPDEVNGIPVNLQADRLYFFHTSAWSELAEPGTPVMLYRIHYADGSVREIPVRNRYEIGNWWDVKKPQSPGAHGAWMNSRKRGFYVYEWVNPEPEKDIRSIDVVSLKTRVIVAVIGISAELHAGNRKTVRFNTSSAGGWNGVKVEKAGADSFRCVIGPESKDWSGCRILLPKPLKITPELLETGVIRLTLEGDKDNFGNPVEGFDARIKIFLFSNTMKNSREYKPARSMGPLRVSIPLSSLLDANSDIREINGMAFQFLGKATAGFRVKDARIEYRNTAE